MGPKQDIQMWLDFDTKYNFVTLTGKSLSEGLILASTNPQPEPIWIKVKKSWLLLPQYQITYPRGPEFVSIEIPPFRPHFIKLSKTVFYLVNLVS